MWQRKEKTNESSCHKKNVCAFLDIKVTNLRRVWTFLLLLHVKSMINKLVLCRFLVAYEIQSPFFWHIIHHVHHLLCWEEMYWNVIFRGWFCSMCIKEWYCTYQTALVGCSQSNYLKFNALWYQYCILCSEWPLAQLGAHKNIYSVLFLPLSVLLFYPLHRTQSYFVVHFCFQRTEV